jgi:NitT/TauT family transport system substrate-binding protein
MRRLGLAVAVVLIAAATPAGAQTRAKPEPAANADQAPKPAAASKRVPAKTVPPQAPQSQAVPASPVREAGPLRPDERISNPAADRPRAGELRIGVGHGIGFLPLFLANDLKLFEKHAKAAGLNGRILIQRFYSAAALHQALEKGNLAAGTYGLSAFLQAREAPKQMVAISGVTTLPMVLLTSRADISSLSDIKAGHKIAVPLMTAPQMTYLRLQAQQWFTPGLWTRLQQQVIVMPHQEAVDALTEGKGDIAAYFSSPPFTQMAMKDSRVRPILSSVDALGGKSSFFILASPRETLAAQPQLAEVVAKAVDEAASIIAKDPKRAALTWLKYEPSHKLDAHAVEAILHDLKDEFGSGIYGVTATATFLARDGRLKSAVWNWKDVVAPALAAGPGS